MTEKERIELLEEIMDLNPGTLHPNDTLAEFDEWDSLSELTFIAEMDHRFGKRITGEEIKAFITVADAIVVMQ